MPPSPAAARATLLTRPSRAVSTVHIRVWDSMVRMVGVARARISRPWCTRKAPSRPPLVVGAAGSMSWTWDTCVIDPT